MSKPKRIVEITLQHNAIDPYTEVVITRQTGHGVNTKYEENTYVTNYRQMCDLAEKMKEYVEKHNAELEIEADYKSLAVTVKVY